WGREHHGLDDAHAVDRGLPDDALDVVDRYFVRRARAVVEASERDRFEELAELREDSILDSVPVGARVVDASDERHLYGGGGVGPHGIGAEHARGEARLDGCDLLGASRRKVARDVDV